MRHSLDEGALDREHGLSAPSIAQSLKGLFSALTRRSYHQEGAPRYTTLQYQECAEGYPLQSNDRHKAELKRSH